MPTCNPRTDAYGNNITGIAWSDLRATPLGEAAREPELPTSHLEFVEYTLGDLLETKSQNLSQLLHFAMNELHKLSDERVLICKYRSRWYLKTKRGILTCWRNRIQKVKV